MIDVEYVIATYRTKLTQAQNSGDIRTARFYAALIAKLIKTQEESE